MKVLFCNERFLFRFGLDRVLLLLAKALKDQGHSVYLLGNFFNQQVVEPLVDGILEVPPAPDDPANANEFTGQWLEEHWSVSSFPDLNAGDLDGFDLVVIGGWPFFLSVDFFKRLGPSVVFIDAGAVPLEGFSGHALEIQQKLRTLRRQNLKKFTAILPISQFIATSQSLPDRGFAENVWTVLLGADHLQQPLWQSSELATSELAARDLGTHDRPIDHPEHSGLLTCRELQAQGKRCILNLGRWEPGCYKNSEACFEWVEALRVQEPAIALLVLSEPGDINIPAHLKSYIYPVGFPDDASLQKIMEQVSLGISVSRWEGFNLPLAEMQWLRKPALAFDLAAHPEVIVHPWFLCQDIPEMVDKAYRILTGNTPADACNPQGYERFQQHFRWDGVIAKYLAYFRVLAEHKPTVLCGQVPPTERSKTHPIEQLLYPQCGIENWPMPHAERMALTGLLARLQPECSLGIGTHDGGSLSLISQFSRRVFSMDTDPTIAAKLAPNQNVSLLTGDSTVLLPLLFQALEEQKISVDFIFLKGDRIAANLGQNLGMVLQYRPRKPLIVVIHGAFNPALRRQILDANWAASSYVAQVEVDFVPGRMVEAENDQTEGRLRGGIAIALLQPVPRIADLYVNQGAAALYRAALQSSMALENFSAV